jgi:hypothetical protein
MTEHATWVVLKTYRAVYEAEFGAPRLEAAGIPARVDTGDSMGVFGPGYQGTVTGGVGLLVPADLETEARSALLADNVGGI